MSRSATRSEAARRALRRAARGLGVALVALLAAAAALTALLLASRGAREAGLREALRRADAALPGAFAWTRLGWPQPWRLEADGLLWIDGADTLARADNLVVALDGGALLHRDVVIRRLAASGIAADLPRLRARLPQRPDAAATAAPDRAPFFPRAGALPPLPSLALREVRIEDAVLRLAPGRVLRDGSLAGSLTLRRGEPPLARVDTLAARDDGGLWAVADGSLTLDLREGVLAARASGAAAGWPFALAAATAGDGTYRLALARRDAGAPPEGTGLLATGRFQEVDGAVASVTIDAQLVTPGTAELAAIVGRPLLPAGWPEQPGLRLLATGVVTLRPEAGGGLLLRAPGGAAGDSLRAELTLSAAGARVDTLVAAWKGLALGGSGRFEDRTVQASVGATVRGTRWLAALAPSVAAPDSLAVDLAARLAGPAKSPAASLRLGGGLRQGGFRLERADVTLDGALAPPGAPLAFTLAARALGLDLTGRGEARLGDTLSVTLPPLRLAAVPGGPRDHAALLARLRAAEAAAAAPAWPARGTLRYAPASGHLRARGLQLALDEDRVLLEADGAPADPGNPARGLALDATLRVPGPGRLSPLVAPLPAARGLGPVTGRVAFAARPAAGPGAFDLRADLGATSWIDTALAVARRRAAVTQIETLTVALPGVALRGVGLASADSLDLALRLDVSDARTLRLFAPALDDSARVALRATVDVSGPARAPRGAARLAGSLAIPPLAIPTIEGSADWGGSSLRSARIAAPGGLSAGQLALTTAEVAYRDDATGSGAAPPREQPLPGVITVRAEGTRLALLHRARVERTTGAWLVRGDTLAAALGGRGLRSRRPFAVEVGDGGAWLSVRDLDLSGELGSVRGGGHVGADSAGFALDAELALPAAPPVPNWPADLWPAGVAITARAGADSATLNARAEGLRLGHREGLAVSLSLTGAPDGAHALLTAGDARGEIARLAASLPAALRTWPPQLAVRDGDIEAVLALDAFPLVVPAPGRPWRGPTPELSGRARLAGPARAPAVGARLRLALPAARGETGHVTEIATRLLAPAAAPAELPTPLPASGGAALPVQPAEPPAVPGAFAAAWTFSRGGVEAGRGSLLLPLRWTDGAPALPTAPRDSLAASMSARDLPLADLNYLLAGALSLEGRLSLDIAAEGPALDPRLRGELVASDLRARLANGTWARARGDVSLSGTGRRPALRGRAQIDQGVLVVPEVRPALLPAAGEATLWQAAAPDTARGPARPSPGEPPVAPGRFMDVDVELSIPAGFWIRGRGLDVELAGELAVAQRDGAPVVLGELGATRGELMLLDRRFAVERGRAVFYGSAIVDPEIDLALASRQDDLLVRVLMTGTALQPQLRLVSEPEMAEGDIMARLVFGKPLDQLDENETGLVQDRALSVAETFATARLEAMLSRQLGVDMLRLKTGETGGRSVEVGKYLSRRALLRYEQSLQAEQANALGLEYWLTRGFKLETSLSRTEQSGLDLKWSRDY